MIREMCRREGISFFVFDFQRMELAVQADAEGLLLQAQPVGSILKPLTLCAALSAGLNPSQTISCKPSARAVPAELACWDRGGHGNVDAESALACSCNRYFAAAIAPMAAETFLAMGSFLHLAWAPLSAFRQSDEMKIRAVLGLSVALRPQQVFFATAAILGAAPLMELRRDSSGFFEIKVVRTREEMRARILPECAELIRRGMARVQRDGNLRNGGTNAPPMLVKTGTAPTKPGAGVNAAWVMAFFPGDDIRWGILLRAPRGSGAEAAWPAALRVLRQLGMTENGR